MLILGSPSAKVGLSAKFGVAVFKASISDSLWGPSAKVGSSANFCVSLLYYPGGSIGQRRFVCQI